MTAPSATALASLQAIYSKAGFALVTPTRGQAAAAGMKCRDAVVANFMGFTKPLEGQLTYMYTDVKGLVTTGLGNLIDPIAAALALPWQNADGSAASQADVTSAWNTVKGAYPGTQSTGCSSLTTIRLTPAGVQTLVMQKLRSNDIYLAQNLPGYTSWPADAQLAVNSMAWAMGAGFIASFKNFVAALSKTPPDFNSASNPTLCGINATGNPGVVPRNTADQLLLDNASKVAGGTGNPEILYFLNPVTGGGGLGSVLPTAGAPGLLFSALLAIGSGIAGFFTGGLWRRS